MVKKAPPPNITPEGKHFRYIAFGFLLLFALPTLLWLADWFFPNIPPVLKASDGPKVQATFFGGPPALILCENSTSLRTAGAVVRALASDLEIPSYRMDCTARLGASAHGAFDRLHLSAWNPTAFLVANGRMARQLSPQQLADGAGGGKAREALAKALAKLLAVKHTRVDHSYDLAQCIANAAQGCVLVYSKKPAAAAAAEVAPAVAAHRAHTWALLNARERAFQAAASPALEALVRDAVAEARAGAGKGALGTVLIGLRAVSGRDSGGGGNLLATVVPAAGAALTPADAAKLVAAQLEALKVVKALAGAGGGGGSGAAGADAAADAAIARDEALANANSALTTKEAILIARVVNKAEAKAAAAAAAAAAEAAVAEAAEVAEAAAGAAERGESAGDAEEDARARAAAEVERRRRMAEEEDSSPHVAHASDGEGEEGTGGDSSAGEEDVDLDAQEL
jgi:hypothetical protein